MYLRSFCVEGIITRIVTYSQSEFFMPTNDEQFKGKAYDLHQIPFLLESN